MPPEARFLEAIYWVFLLKTGLRTELLGVKIWNKHALSHLSTIVIPILVFSWRLLLNRLPTREQLLRRNIILANLWTSCVFYFGSFGNSEPSISLLLSSVNMDNNISKARCNIGAPQHSLIKSFNLHNIYAWLAI